MVAGAGLRIVAVGRGAMKLEEASPEFKHAFQQGYTSGYSMGIAVGAMGEACNNKLHSYSDIVPKSFFEHMYQIAAKLNYSLVIVEEIAAFGKSPAMARVEIRRIRDNKGNATVHLKPSPTSIGKVGL